LGVLHRVAEDLQAGAFFEEVEAGPAGVVGAVYVGLGLGQEAEDAAGRVAIVCDVSE